MGELLDLRGQPVEVVARHAEPADRAGPQKVRLHVFAGTQAMYTYSSLRQPNADLAHEEAGHGLRGDPQVVHPR
jgi:hypothetical protein